MKQIIYIVLVTLSLQSFTFRDQTNFYTQLEPKTNFYIETGYVGFGDGNNQMFYHLFLKEGITSLANVSQDDKFILWLNGGPGCSALQHIFQNVGPYHLNEGIQVTKGDSTWNKVAHVIFVDQPFEVGLSYSDPNIRVKGSDEGALYMVEFFRIFFENRPQFRKAQFYVFGVSFGGHYVPAIGAALAKSNLDMNFKGIGVGNGWTDAFNQYKSFAPMLYSVGLVSDNTKQFTSELMAKGQNYVLDGEFQKSTQEGFGGIFYILATQTGAISPYDFQDYVIQGPAESLLEEFINHNKQQFGVPDNIIYTTCSAQVLQDFEIDISITQKTNVEYLLSNGKKVMFYQGSRDIICNTPSINYVINQLNWDHIYEWKKQPKTTFKAKFTPSDEEVTAGTIKKYKNLYFATIYNGCHHSPRNIPIASLKAVTHFLNDDEIWD